MLYNAGRAYLMKQLKALKDVSLNKRANQKDGDNDEREA
jgi:hypothetical protein